MIWHAISDCERLRELCRSLKGEIPKKYGLIEISQSQLSKVNKTRDYRVFVWIAYELLSLIWKDHRFWNIKRALKILGFDSTFIKWRSEHSEKGYCSSTGKIEEGIKIHASALLDPLTLPLTIVVTPGDVHDSLEFDDLIEDSKLFVDLHTVILVFDKGYWKMERFKELCEKGYKFVTLMKKGIKYEVISKFTNLSSI